MHMFVSMVWTRALPNTCLLFSRLLFSSSVSLWLIERLGGDVDVRCEQRATSGKEPISILATCAVPEPESRPPHAAAPRPATGTNWAPVYNSLQHYIYILNGLPTYYFG